MNKFLGRSNVGEEKQPESRYFMVESFMMMVMMMVMLIMMMTDLRLKPFSTCFQSYHVDKFTYPCVSKLS